MQQDNTVVNEYLVYAGFTGLTPPEPNTLGNTEAPLPAQDSPKPSMPNSPEALPGQDVQDLLREFTLPDDI